MPTTFMKIFRKEATAIAYMRKANRKFRYDGFVHSYLVVVDGPQDNFCVVDQQTANDLDIGFKMEVPL